MKRRKRRALWPSRAQPRTWVPSLLIAAVICLAWYAGEGLNALPGSSPSYGSETFVTIDTVNLRTGPSTDHAIVTVLESAQEVSATGPARNGFVPVKVDGRTGWLAEEFLGDVVSSSLTASGPQVAVAGELPSSDQTVADTEPEAGNRQEAVDEETSPDPPPTVAPDAERWIRIDRSEATVSLMAGDTVLAQFNGRIGRDPTATGFYATAVGTFRVYSMHKELASTPFAENTWLTDWVGFDPVRKNGIHSPVRESDGSIRDSQNTTTLGCVRLDAEDAVRVFDFAFIGMRVEVVE